MRIISGKYKGKKIVGFDIDGTRPTMDRVKESIFGSIQNKLKNAVVLDLFAGSGSLGLEAISNGVKEVYLVDNNDIAIKTLKQNSAGMNDEIRVIKSDYEDFLNAINKKFDIIFLDPPYNLRLINNSLAIIKKRNLLNNGGIIICEYGAEQIKCDFKIIREKKYGKTNVIILRNDNTVKK